MRHAAPPEWTEFLLTCLKKPPHCRKTVDYGFKLPVPLIEEVFTVYPLFHIMRPSSRILFVIDESAIIPVYDGSFIDRCLSEVTGVDTAFGGNVI